MELDSLITQTRAAMQEANSELQAASQVLQVLTQQFTPDENKALESIMPYFVQDLTHTGKLGSYDMLQLDHVMQYLGKGPNNRTQCYNCISKNVPADMILQASKGRGGKGSHKSNIVFSNFQGFCLAVLQFRSPRAKLVARLASKCTQIMSHMLYSGRQERDQLKKETDQLKKKVSALQETQLLTTQVLPLLTAYYHTIHSGEPPQEFLISCLTRICQEGLAHHRGLAHLASVPYLNRADPATLDRVWDICRGWRPLPSI